MPTIVKFTSGWFFRYPKQLPKHMVDIVFNMYATARVMIPSIYAAALDSRGLLFWSKNQSNTKPPKKRVEHNPYPQINPHPSDLREIERVLVKWKGKKIRI